jgi:hypothetical protein
MKKLMTKNKFIYTAFTAAMVLVATSCQDQLDVGNPNQPTISANVNTEIGLISLAKGAVYVNGFLNGDDWLGNSYFSLPMGYNELMADNVGASASNNQVTTIGQPDYIILDDKSTKTNSSPSVGIIRTYNTRAATGADNNAIHYEWLNMYAMNNACNLVLSVADEIPFTGDADSRLNTVKAWCYWWKAFAYAGIGSKYYYGLIVNEYGESSDAYVGHDAMIEESNRLFNLAASTLGSISSTSDYLEVLGELIPDQNQSGNGGVLSIDEWKRSINTMLARNLLFNKLSPFVDGNLSATITGSSMSGTMSTADWNSIVSLTTNGVREGDKVFVGYTVGTNDFFSASGGTVAALTAAPASNSTYKVSERVIQCFNAGDQRLTNNFIDSAGYNNDYIYTTRYTMVNGGKKMKDVVTYGTKKVGAHELVMTVSYEENALMLAEANIRLGNIEAGLLLVDNVRDYMGAGVAAVAGTGLGASEAMNELAKERRTSLLFRGLTYYDNRRFGWSYDIAKGGGRYGTVIVLGKTINKDATINYNFMDYWDVPANEAVLNPDAAGSTLQNPNY